MIAASGVRRSWETVESSVLRSSSVRARSAALSRSSTSSARSSASAPWRVKASSRSRSSRVQPPRAPAASATTPSDRGPERSGRQWTRLPGSVSVPAPAGLAVLEAPARDRELRALERQLARDRRRREHLPAPGEQHRHAAPEDLRERARDRARRLALVERAPELAAEREQRGRALLALDGAPLLPPDAQRERADHDAHGEHHAEREQVPRVGDGERVERLDEEEVVGRDRQRRRDERRDRDRSARRRA